MLPSLLAQSSVVTKTSTLTRQYQVATAVGILTGAYLYGMGPELKIGKDFRIAHGETEPGTLPAASVMITGEVLIPGKESVDTGWRM